MKRWAFRWLPGSFLPWGLLLAACAGCSPPPTLESYKPAADESRRALETALEAWRKGKPTGQVSDGPPAVCVVDTHRRADQVLSRYTILGQSDGDNCLCFTVRLFLKNPEEELKARYVLLGIDPLWVFRQEDYDMMSHWECKEPSQVPASKSSKNDSKYSKHDSPRGSKP